MSVEEIRRAALHRCIGYAGLSVKLDAIRVRVYHEVTGGSQGGGGGEVRRPGLLPFAGFAITEQRLVSGHFINLAYTFSLLATTLTTWEQYQNNIDNISYIG